MLSSLTWKFNTCNTFMLLKLNITLSATSTFFFFGIFNFFYCKTNKLHSVQQSAEYILNVNRGSVCGHPQKRTLSGGFRDLKNRSSFITQISRTYFVQSFLNYGLALVVEGRGRHVQQQDPRIPDKRSGDGDTLLLTAAHLTSALPDQGVEFLSDFKRQVK